MPYRCFFCTRLSPGAFGEVCAMYALFFCAYASQGVAVCDGATFADLPVPGFSPAVSHCTHGGMLVFCWHWRRMGIRTEVAEKGPRDMIMCDMR